MGFLSDLLSGVTGAPDNFDYLNHQVGPMPMSEMPQVHHIQAGDGVKPYSFLDRLGDAFLIQSGNAPMHRQRYNQEMIGSALQLDPDMKNPETVSAIAAIDPNFLDKYQTHQDNTAYRSAMLDARKAHWGTMDDRTKAATQKIYREAALRSLAGARSPEEYAAAKMNVVRALEQQGMDLSDLPPIPEVWSDNVRELGGDPLKWANYHQTVSHQGVMEDISRQNANANTTKAGAAVTNAATGQARQATNERESPSRISKNESQGAYYQGKSNAGPPLPGGSPKAAPTAGGTPSPTRKVGWYSNGKENRYWDGTKWGTPPR